MSNIFLELLIVLFWGNGNSRVVDSASDLIKTKEYIPAASMLSPYVKEHQNNGKAVFLLSLAYYDLAWWDSIIAISDRIEQKKSPEWADANFMLGIAYYKKFEPAYAVKYIYNSAIDSARVKRAFDWLKKYFNIPKLMMNFNDIDDEKPVGIFNSTDNIKAVGEFRKGLSMGLMNSNIKLKLTDKSDNPNISILVGPYLSQQCTGCVVNVFKAFRPVLCPLAEDVRIPVLGPFVPLNREIGLELVKGVDYFSGKLGYLNYGIMYDCKDPIAVSGFKLLKQVILAYNANISRVIPFTKDSTYVLAELDSSDIEQLDVLFVLGRTDFTLTVFTSMRREYQDIPIFVFSRWKSITVRQNLTVLDSIYFAAPPFKRNDLLKLEEDKYDFSSRYSDVNGVPPTFFALRGYDVGKILSKIYMQNEQLSAADFWNKLYNMQYYNGISGNFVFRDDIKLLKMYMFKNGKITEYKED